jgi:hypothetical protein
MRRLSAYSVGSVASRRSTVPKDNFCGALLYASAASCSQLAPSFLQAHHTVFSEHAVSGTCQKEQGLDRTDPLLRTRVHQTPCATGV